jgi:hypothetical protein
MVTGGEQNLPAVITLALAKAEAGPGREKQ